MIARLYRLFTGFGVKAHLLLGFGLMVMLTVSVGGVGWWGVSNIQQTFEKLRQESLPEIAQSMALAEHAASLVAQAPFVANAKILFHLDEESARLREKLNAFSALVRDLRSRGLESGLDGLARQIEASLIDLIEVTRDGILLTARMHDRHYALTSAYGALENTIVEHMKQAMEGAEADNRALLLSAILGETHRIAGTLMAAVTADDAGKLRGLETQYKWGSLLLRSKLDQLSDPELRSSIGKTAKALINLGIGTESIFALRHEQFGNEDRRSYLLTASNLLAAEINDRVNKLVGKVKNTTEHHSNAAAAVLDDSKIRILFLGAICLAAAIFSAFYVVRDLGGNLSAVTRSMTELADGNRRIEMPGIARTDEIGDLARAFKVFKETMLRLDDTSQQLAGNNRLLQTIFQSMNGGLSVFDADGRLLARNSRFLELYGVSEAELDIGTPIEVIDRMLAKGNVTIRSLDGRLIPPEQLHRECRRAVRQVEAYLPDGRILELRSSPMRDGGFVTIYTDLTERKAIEAQLQQAQKMESVGQLTGGLAHDFNNLLAAITGNLSLLQEELAGQDKLRKKVLRALEAADRGATITQRLLAFSRKQTLQPQPVDVNELIEGIMDLLDYSVGESIAIESSLQEDVWTIVIDPGQLENSLMNLVLNSRDAMPEGGKLYIRTRNCPVDDVTYHRDIEPGDYVMIEVEDSGVGMPQQVLDRVVEPFFTTKEFGAGSGLGLSMVYGFIKQSGGHLLIDSAPGEGTTVRLYLPRAGEAAAERPLSKRQPEAAERGQHEATILLVEDDVQVRETAADMLSSLGHRVVQAGDGHEALARLDERPDIALLFADVVLLGGLSGPDVAAAVRNKRPDIKVLFSSGYSHNELVEEGYLKGEVALIAKPYKKESLARKLNEVLEQPSL